MTYWTRYQKSTRSQRFTAREVSFVVRWSLHKTTDPCIDIGPFHEKVGGTVNSCLHPCLHLSVSVNTNEATAMCDDARKKGRR